MPGIGWQEIVIVLVIIFTAIGPAIVVYAIFRLATRHTRKTISSKNLFTCPKCHEGINYGARYCEHCGEPVTWSPQSKECQ